MCGKILLRMFHIQANTLQVTGLNLNRRCTDKGAINYGGKNLALILPLGYYLSGYERNMCMN